MFPASRNRWSLFSAALILATACFCGDLPAQETGTAEARSAELGRAALAVRKDYLDAVQSRARADLPIGVFDSGTGGLAVLEEILRLDQFDNASHQPRPGGDGRPDFAAEQFLFLADQANMPYGNYPAAGKRDFLVELVLCDALFLLSPGLVQTIPESALAEKQPPVKTIVIACNTATAHAKRNIESLIDQAEIDVHVINVIDAGAHGALELLRRARDASVGVIATAGTVSSGAYPAVLEQLAADYAIDKLTVVQQGSIGLAGAIDGVPDYIDRAAQRPRSGYRGPALSGGAARIDAAILSRYGFDFAAQRMLWEGDSQAPRELQINSVENYVAYECVSLLEELRGRAGAAPLSVVILGCTHFPYYTGAFRAELERLRDLQEAGRFVYRDLIAERVELVDPATVAARQLYRRLQETGKLRSASAAASRRLSGFYLTTPDRRHPGAQLDAAGNFTHEYKYGRDPGLHWRDVQVVPLTPDRFDPASAARLQGQLPAVWQRLQEAAEAARK